MTSMKTKGFVRKFASVNVVPINKQNHSDVTRVTPKKYIFRMRFLDRFVTITSERT